MSSAQSPEQKEPEQRTVVVSVSEDSLKVLVNITAPQSDVHAAGETIQSQMNTLKIISPLMLDDIVAWLENTQDEAGRIKNGVLFEGEAATLSIDGTIEWADDYFSTGFYIDPKTGAIDFRQRTRCSSVSKDALLATIIPGTPGQNGKDVFGERIVVAKPKTPRLTAGENVKKGDKGNVYFATENGRVELKGDSLKVSDILIISGDIGLKTGHIHHKGSVLVENDILEDSKVYASGDIEVRGIVEASSITTEGNLYVTGGIYGKKGFSIKVGGEIHAKFISESNVEAGGDVIIEREIAHSIVKSQGAVRLPQGRIVGGKITALGGIDVNEAGSDACVPTQLSPGVDFQLEQSIDEDMEKIDSMRKEEGDITKALKKILPSLKSLSPDKQKAALQFLEKAKSLAKSATELEENIQKKKNHSKESSVPMIMIQKTIYPEVRVRITNEHYHYKHLISGPVKVECRAAKIRTKAL